MNVVLLKCDGFMQLTHPWEIVSRVLACPVSLLIRNILVSIQ
jgi:hypothetical protein